MLKQLCLIQLTILTLSACNQRQTSDEISFVEFEKLTDSVNTNSIDSVKSGEITFTIDSTFPCQLLNPDTSVFDIILCDRKSTIKQVGEKFDLIEPNFDLPDMPYINYCSQDSNQTLTLFFHPGGFRNQFSEFQVKYYSGSDNATTIKSIEFETGSGIKLGLSKEKVIAILGNCFKTHINDKSNEVIRFHIDDYENSNFLQRFNYPSYYAEYEFQNNNLIRFRFGFQYP